MSRPLSVLIVEDEVLLAVELGFLVREAGCHEVGHALDSASAVELAQTLEPDIALVDVHLADGPTGVAAARQIAEGQGAIVLFMTANVKRLPEDLAGACGVIGKPYSDRAVRRALTYLARCLQDGAAPGPPPPGLALSERFVSRWGVDQLAQAV
ncbi:response regulator [Phenylobacterium sp.]|uniref:response regulator n=1 Tax=Phenylobacterium sp. TaxID=1871053 RepID=UPI000C8C8C55|nr:response regulator [Phenylobacterium sp.]MAK82730.1 response regulator [Phenylobacterium sp.]|tara:strand:- start:3322 stop:3783 length:462 start_codon:yes stop_codon:yes gene_type:complete